MLFSQNDTNTISYGIFFGYGLNFHNADFKKLPDCPSCSPGYKDGSGSGLNFGIVVDYPLDEQFAISSKLLYKDLSAKLINTETTKIIVNGVPQDGEFEHSLDSKLNVFGIEPALKYKITRNLKVNLGILISFLVTKDYSQVEKITKPSDFGTFLDEFGNDTKSRERNKFSGTLQTANSIFIAPMVSVSYTFPLNKSGEFYFEPEVMYHLGLTNFVNSDIVNKWTANSLTGGLSIKYSPQPAEELKYEYKKIEKIDSIRIESEAITKRNVKIGIESIINKTEQFGNIVLNTKEMTRIDTIFFPKIHTLDADVSAFGVNKNGIESKDPVISIEEFQYSRFDPLLNYVFFDDNSAEISSKYKILNKNQKEKFEIDSLYQVSTLDIYHNILNIIGQRLNKFPKSKITLIGCNSDFGNEKNNKNLSLNRAENIKKYFVDIWDIDSDRIIVKSQNLPDKASTPTNEPDKMEENRRVELFSDDVRVTDPVFIENIQRISNPPILRFKLKSNSSAGLESWDFSAYQNENSVLGAFNSNGNGLHSDYIDWNLEKDQLNIPRVKSSLKYVFSVNSKNNARFSTKLKEIPIEVLTIEDKRLKRSEDYKIEKFSLILFDFDKFDIVGNNSKIIERIKKSIEPGSIVEIKGYTDRTGDDNYNKLLSEKRATSAKNSLGKIEFKSEGIGEQELLYDNDIPEGRFYCRTVEIIVKTKIK
jgi:outer membrane protein OmpA-like peptidoglycan-associated protein